jgi:hypothetical protein
MIVGIGTLFAGAMRLLSVRERTQRYADVAEPYEHESLEEKLGEGELDVEEYKAINAVVQPDETNIA